MANRPQLLGLQPASSRGNITQALDPDTHPSAIADGVFTVSSPSHLAPSYLQAFVWLELPLHSASSWVPPTGLCPIAFSLSSEP